MTSGRGTLRQKIILDSVGLIWRSEICTYHYSFAPTYWKCRTENPNM